MKNKEILLVDDTIPLLEELSSIFEMEGYEVTCHSLATDAIHYLENKKPDIIITDIVMPGMSGVEFIENIKSNKSLEHIPIIVLTADNTLMNSEILEKYSISALLTKPCNVDKLLFVIEKAIDPD